MMSHKSRESFVEFLMENGHMTHAQAIALSLDKDTFNDVLAGYEWCQWEAAKSWKDLQERNARSREYPRPEPRKREKPPKMEALFALDKPAAKCPSCGYRANNKRELVSHISIAHL